MSDTIRDGLRNVDSPVGYQSQCLQLYFCKGNRVVSHPQWHIYNLSDDRGVGDVLVENVSDELSDLSQVRQ